MVVIDDTLQLDGSMPNKMRLEKEFSSKQFALFINSVKIKTEVNLVPVLCYSL